MGWRNFLAELDLQVALQDSIKALDLPNRVCDLAIAAGGANWELLHHHLITTFPLDRPDNCLLCWLLVCFEDVIIATEYRSHIRNALLNGIGLICLRWDHESTYVPGTTISGVFPNQYRQAISFFFLFAMCINCLPHVGNAAVKVTLVAESLMSGHSIYLVALERRNALFAHIRDGRTPR